MVARRLDFNTRPPQGAKSFCCAFLVLVCVAPLVTATQARADDPARFSGTWEYVGGESEHEGLLEAIEHCVEQLNFLIRPLARRRLVQSSPIPSQVVIQAEASQVSVQQGQGPTLSSQLGSVIPVTSVDGDRIELSYRMQEDALVQRVANPDGARQTIYRLDPKGRQLRAEVTTSSRFFSRALVYNLTFERVTRKQVSRGPSEPLTASQ